MGRNLFYSGVTISLAVLAVLLSRGQSPAAAPLLPGRNNTVLFITADAPGLSNVHVATSFALAEEHPSVEVHFASFATLSKKISRVSTTARARNVQARSIIWHELPGEGFIPTIARTRPWHEIMSPAGMTGIEKTVRDVGLVMAPWEPEEHWILYNIIRDLVEEVDPAVVVMDTIFRPAVEVMVNSNRRVIAISPNALTELFVAEQPWLGSLWKYPSTSSGYPYPLPWRLIPTNIYMQFRLMWGVLTAPRVAFLSKFMSEKGVQTPSQFNIGVPGIQLVLSTFPEANLPLTIPAEATICGPIVLDAEPVADQDPELAQWLERGPTMLVLLGHLIDYNYENTKQMVGALEIVLRETDVQVLWKYKKADDYNSQAFDPVQQYIDSGRLRVEAWLKPEPISLLQSGAISLMVGHGGAGGFHEAILAGVPQVILPAWFDHYNFAQLVEFLGIGIWPNKHTAPRWLSQELADGFLTALEGETSMRMRERSKELGDIAKKYGGRAVAAAKLADMAAMGKVRDVKDL